MYGFMSQVEVIIFVLVIAGFLHLLVHTHVINNLLKKISYKLRDKLYLLITILIIVFALCGTIFNIWEETIPFYPILSPVLIELGFDQFAVIFVILLGSVSGAIGATINPFAIGVAERASNLGNNTVVSSSNQLLTRFIFFLIFLSVAVLIGNLYCYYNSNKYKDKLKGHDKTNLNYFNKIFIAHDFKKEYALYKKNSFINKSLFDDQQIKNLTLEEKLDEQALTNQNKNIINTKKLVVGLDDKKHTIEVYKNLPKFSGSEKAILIVTLITFIIMVGSLIPWDDLLNTNIFQQASNSIDKYAFYFVSNNFFKKPFGNWDFIELSALFFIAALIVGILGRISDKKFFKLVFKDGSADLILVVFIIAFFAGIAQMLEKSNLLSWILHHLEQSFKGIPFVVICIILYFLFFILAVFIPSITSLALAVFPIFGPLIYVLSNNNSNAVAVVIIIFVFANGLANMIAPSVGVIHAVCYMQKITYHSYIITIVKIWLFYVVITLAGTIVIALLI